MWNYPAKGFPSLSAWGKCAGPGPYAPLRDINDALAWLWDQVDVLLPDLKPNAWVSNDTSAVQFENRATWYVTVSGDRHSCFVCRDNVTGISAEIMPVVGLYSVFIH